MYRKTFNAQRALQTLMLSGVAAGMLMAGAAQAVTLTNAKINGQDVSDPYFSLPGKTFTFSGTLKADAGDGFNPAANVQAFLSLDGKPCVLKTFASLEIADKFPDPNQVCPQGAICTPKMIPGYSYRTSNWVPAGQVANQNGSSSFNGNEVSYSINNVDPTVVYNEYETNRCVPLFDPVTTVVKNSFDGLSGTSHIASDGSFSANITLSDAQIAAGFNPTVFFAINNVTGMVFYSNYVLRFNNAFAKAATFTQSTIKSYKQTPANGAINTNADVDAFFTSLNPWLAKQSNGFVPADTVNKTITGYAGRYRSYTYGTSKDVILYVGVKDTGEVDYLFDGKMVSGFAKTIGTAKTQIGIQ